MGSLAADAVGVVAAVGGGEGAWGAGPALGVPEVLGGLRRGPQGAGGVQAGTHEVVPGLFGTPVHFLQQLEDLEVP